MKIIWSETSEADLHEIVSYIAEDNPVAAFDLLEAITLSVAQNLPDNPNMGRPGRVQNTRELVVHENYIAAYRVSAETIVILAVSHAAKLWPNTFE